MTTQNQDVANTVVTVEIYYLAIGLGASSVAMLLLLGESRRISGKAIIESGIYGNNFAVAVSTVNTNPILNIA